MTTQQTATKTYFDLHTTGIGYLSNIREVKPKKGQPFMACDISALSGSTDDVEYRKFSCNVVGQDAEKLVRKSQAAVERGDKVLIAFTLGDLWADLFTYSKGEKAGETGVMLKARLLRIKMIKINGKTVFKEEKHTSQETENATEETSDVSAENAD